MLNGIRIYQASRGLSAIGELHVLPREAGMLARAWGS